MLDRLRDLHQMEYDKILDPDDPGRIAQYEMAYRMQTSVPEVTRLSDEPDHVLELYGPDSRTPGTFAANCLLARRLAERDVRFIQLYHPVGTITAGCLAVFASSARKPIRPVPA